MLKTTGIIIALIGVLTGIGWWLITENQHLTAKLSAADKQAQTDRGTITALRNNLDQQAAAQQALNESLTAVATTASQRQQTIQELINENAALKEWGDRPVPDDIADRLQRPASTGLSDYRQQLPHRQPLHPERDKPPDE